MGKLFQVRVLSGVGALVIGIVLLGMSSGVGLATTEVPGENLRTCGGQAFPLSVFDQPAGFQKEETSLAAAVRREIKQDPWLMPKRGWRLVFKNAKIAEVVAGKPARNGNVWSSYRKRKGKWVGDSYWSNCWFEPALKEASAGEWFPKKRQKVTPQTTSLKVDVYEKECNSGKPAWGRIPAPTIEYWPKRIIVTYSIRWKTGSFAETCPSNPPLTKTLNLAEPLGTRSIVDGGRFPYPRRVAPSSWKAQFRFDARTG